MSRPNPPSTGGRVREALTAALCLAILVTGATMGLRAAREKSLTYDERYYTAQAATIASGKPTCDFVLQPPLTMHLAALGIRAGGSVASPWPRVPFLVLLVATGALVAWWSSRLYGPAAAVTGALLVAFSPNMLAHASMATTDFPVAAMMFANLWVLRAFLAAPTATRALLWSVTFGLAVLAKLTGLLLLPAAGFVGIGLLLTRTIPWRWALLWPAIFAPLAVTALIWALYGFQPCGFHTLWEQVELRLDQNQTGSGYSIYVLGRIFDHGVWYYYLATTALKEPLPFLALLVVACLRPVRPRGGSGEIAYLLVAPAIVFVVASASIHQLGHRYILPVFLPLYVWVSGLASRSGTAVRAFVAVALALYVADAVRIAPHFLAYTNQLIAPERAYHYLADSNLDWLQDDDSPEVKAVRAEWDLVDPSQSHTWNAGKKPALLIGATALSGMWVPHGFWGSPFTLQIRERGYRPARHVAYSQFLFPLDSAALVRDLDDWYRSRSWVESYNLRVRFASELGLVPPPIGHRAAEPLPAGARCRSAVRRIATLDGKARVDVPESFTPPALPAPPPQSVLWTGALRIERPGTYLLRLGPATRRLQLGGRRVPLDRKDADPTAPVFVAMRLDAGLHSFAATQEGDALDGRLDVALSRLDFDPAGYATPISLAVETHLCLLDDVTAPGVPSAAVPPRP